MAAISPPRPPSLREGGAVRRWLVAIACTLIMGCAARPLSEVARDLGDLDADVRASAAETLEDAARDKKDLPNDVVEALLYRAAVETDLETRASIARALGETGDARAKEVLDAYARTDDPEQREVASIALQTWSIRSGRVKPGHVFAADWPYGTEAYPPKLAAKK